MPGFVKLAFRMYSVRSISANRKVVDSKARGLAHTTTSVSTPSYTHEGMGEEEICNMMLSGLLGRRACGMSKKRRKEYREKEKWKYHPWSGGYDAQQAKGAPEELDQMKSGTDLQKHKVMCFCGVREEDRDKV